jgi:hypothetical protein
MSKKNLVLVGTVVAGTVVAGTYLNVKLAKAKKQLLAEKEPELTKLLQDATALVPVAERDNFVTGVNKFHEKFKNAKKQADAAKALDAEMEFMKNVIEFGSNSDAITFFIRYTILSFEMDELKKNYNALKFDLVYFWVCELGSVAATIVETTATTC